MKKRHLAYTVIFITAIMVSFGCLKSASSGSNAIISAGVKNMLQNKWTYTFWSSCPSNPLSETPCFEYNAADTSLYGTGIISLTIGTADTIAWRKEGQFHQTPFSYIFHAPGDTLTYQLVNDSTFTLFNTSSQVINTVKIKALTEHLLVLSYSIPQYSYAYQLDSLMR